MKPLNCPFCGSAPKGIFTPCYGVTAVACSNYDCIAYCRQVSIERWNTRADNRTPTQQEDAYKEKYYKLRTFIESARQESTLVTYQDERGHFAKVQVPYWFMKDPE